jgi:ParB/RepB/Spo0J family partition protein
MAIAGEVIRQDDGLYRLATNEELSDAFVEERIAEVEVIEMRMPRASMTVAKPKAEEWEPVRRNGQLTLEKKFTSTDESLNESKPLASLPLNMEVQQLTYAEIPLGRIVPHPMNPRPFSEKYQCKVEDEKVEELIFSLTRNGYDESEPIKVRPLDDKYQLIRGHHRWIACREIGRQTIPGVIRDMSDKDAAIALMTEQGRPVDNWEKARHAQKCCGSYGKDGLMSVSAYAESIGLDIASITLLIRAADVESKCFTMVKQFSEIFSVRAARVIGSLPEKDWVWFAVLCADGGIKTNNDRESAVKEIKALNKQFEDELLGFSFDLIALDGQKIDSLKTLKKHCESLSKCISYTAKTLQGFGTVVLYDLDVMVEDESDATKVTPKTYEYDARKEFTDKVNKLECFDLKNVKSIESGIQRSITDNLKAYQEWLDGQVEEIEVKAGQWWQLGQHRIYCGSTTDEAFLNGLPEKFAFAFADPPYGANVADWDSEFYWEHDYLVDRADVVAATPGISSIPEFFGITKMPYKWSCAFHINNGMTRGARGFGNWMYVALFSKKDSIHDNAQDHFTISIRPNSQNDIHFKGRKPAELMDKLVEEFTKYGDLVLDPFMGSGSTLLACEKGARICYTGEIDLDRCKTLIEHWQEITGKKAEVVNG